MRPTEPEDRSRTDSRSPEADWRTAAATFFNFFRRRRRRRRGGKNKLERFSGKIFRLDYYSGVRMSVQRPIS